MSKYISNRQKNIKVGIVSYTESNTVLEVTGKVGIGTTNASTNLDVNGGLRIRGALYDKDNQTGNANQVLISTGSGVDWVDAAPANAITGLTITDEGSIVGTANSVALINFVGSGVTATSSGAAATVTISPTISILYDGINTGTGSTTINFKGTGISSVTSSSGISTVIVDLQSNLDGGTPTTNYGGIESINAGGI